MDTNQSAARDARRYLTERVRNDWTFPGLDERDSNDSNASINDADPATAAAASSAADETGPSEDELHGVTEFRERYYGSTDEDDESDDDGGAYNEQQQPNNAPSDASNAEGGREYKFDSPDHVGRRLEERALRRKRRRRAALEEEMRWNDGVRCFVRRRDKWTGAASVRKYARRRSRTSSEMEAEEVVARREVEMVLVETAAVVEEEEEDDEEKAEEVKEGEWEGDSVMGTEGETAGGGEQKKKKKKKKRIIVDIPASEEPLVPLAPPLLPHSAIRQSITPKAYPDIYGKIVVAGQTPKVPINLSHMTRALVQGWKDDGEWPPRPGPADPLMGRKKVTTVGGRVSTLAAVLGGGSAGDGAGGKGASAAGGSGHHGEFLAHHPHLQRGVESVKKVFRLSGGHHGHSTSGGGLVHDSQPPAS